MKYNLKIIEQRKKAGLSQEELADKIGVSRQAVSKWECGESFPDTEKLSSLAKLFNVSLDYLMNEDAENDNSVKDGDNFKKDYKKPFTVTLIIASVLLALSVVLSIILGIQLNKPETPSAVSEIVFRSNLSLGAYTDDDSISKAVVTITLNNPIKEDDKLNLVTVDELGTERKSDMIVNGDYTCLGYANLSVYSRYKIFVEHNGRLTLLYDITINDAHSYTNNLG